MDQAHGVLRVQRGSVVQLSPDFEVNKAFRSCMLTVTEIRPYGVMGYVQTLGDTRDKEGGQAYIRAKWEDIEYVGEAPWITGSLVDQDNGD